jgi:hypothetical protein
VNLLEDMNNRVAAQVALSNRGHDIDFWVESYQVQHPQRGPVPGWMCYLLMHSPVLGAEPIGQTQFFGDLYVWDETIARGIRDAIGLLLEKMAKVLAEANGKPAP